MRLIEIDQDLIAADGLIGVMSSGQDGVTNTVKGAREVYRGSKATLNQFMRSYAARHAAKARAMVLMAPGSVQTEMGRSEAPLTNNESVPNLANVLLKMQGTAGLEYLDYLAAPCGGSAQGMFVQAAAVTRARNFAELPASHSSG